MKQHSDTPAAPDTDTARPLARQVARELTATEIDAIAGGKADTTHATGPNGDDPADPGI
ncbi:hypothetical protein [Marilutibacter chinensis]|uniref:Uncharacterized protein n=1 Tax=Marilutibacter chinensis TaxID=2912247 RepID=A0ABS9HXS1_9GAMM|nr:hypothetical protein [Lysobacter chinensis]MCF7223143.1 hypothetical protein [Lysobacter chinensis]